MILLYLVFVLIGSAMTASVQNCVNIPMKDDFNFRKVQNCVNIPMKDDFNFRKYMGDWYEHSRNENNLQEEYWTCTFATLSRIPNNKLKLDLNHAHRNKVAIFPTSYYGINFEKADYNGRKTNIFYPEDVSAFKATSRAKKIEIAYPLIKNMGELQDYVIVDTDYVSYSIAYRCENLGFTKRMNVWILTKSRNPSKEVLEKAFNAAEKYGFDTSSLFETDQSNCPHK